MAFYDNLKEHLPESIFSQLDTVCTKFQIDGPKRLSHLLGQCAHETGNWKVFTENLNYSADRLLVIFPKYFKDIKSTEGYARNPQKIANKVYASRMGNGDESSGDGFKFRGRGALQTTGKSNYKALGDSIGIDLLESPDLVATHYPLSSAAFFFLSNKLWTICDTGTDIETITRISKRVNGPAAHGLQERIRYTQEYYKILTSTTLQV